MSKHQIVFGISVMVLFCIYAIESCETPEGISGICVELQDCPVLMARFYVNPSDPYLKQCACGLISVIIVMIAFKMFNNSLMSF